MEQNLVDSVSRPDKPLLTGWRLALDRAPLIFSVALLFVLPFLTQLESADPLYPKKAVSQILVFLIFAVWTLRVLVTGRVTWVRTPAIWPLLALVLWLVGMAFLSPYPSIARNALMDSAYLPLWYLMLTLACHELWKVENLLVTFIAASFGTCLWAVAQALGWGEGAWLKIVKDQFGGRVAGGLGNPNFLAGYLMIVWPLVLALALRSSSRLAKVFWGSLLVLSFTALLWTGSKAGWIGWVAGAATFCFFFLKSREGWRKAQNWFLLVLLMFSLSFFISPMSKRLKELVNTQGDSVQFREQVWAGTFEMIKEHPFKGMGFGTFAAAFPSHRPLSLALHQTQLSYEVDHAHNWVLEWVAENGLVGLFLLLAFWASVLYTWYRWHRLYRDKPIPPALSAGAFAVFAGVGVENLFDVNSALPSTLVPLLFLAAFPAALYLGPQYSPEFPVRRVEVDLSKIKVYLLPLFALFLGLSLHQVERAFQKQLDDARLKKAMRLSQARKWDEAITLYGKILAADPSNLEAAYFRGASYADQALAGDREKALSDFEAVGRQAPDYVLLHFKKTQVLAWLGRREESKLEMQRAVKLDPALISQLGEYQEARRLAGAGRFSEALAIYQRLFLDYPTCVPVIVDEANCLVNLKKYPAAIPLYALAAGFDPQNKEVLGNLAWTALVTGEEGHLQKALTLLRKMDPQNPLVAELERKIKGARP